MIDGTFRKSSKGYCQIKNVMGANTLKNTYLTVAHILINGKKEEDYTLALKNLLNQIVTEIPHLRIQMVISDFEKALLNGIQNALNEFNINEQLKRNIKIQGCLFHYAQCLIKTFSKYYNKNKITKNMKQILYILLYGSCIEWDFLIEWFNKLIKLKMMLPKMIEKILNIQIFCI